MLITKKELTNAIDALGLMLLQIAFLVLKLTRVINWSWWWVLAPMWMPIALAVVLVVVLYAVEIIKARK